MNTEQSLLRAHNSSALSCWVWCANIFICTHPELLHCPLTGSCAGGHHAGVGAPGMELGLAGSFQASLFQGFGLVKTAAVGWASAGQPRGFRWHSLVQIRYEMICLDGCYRWAGRWGCQHRLCFQAGFSSETAAFLPELQHDFCFASCRHSKLNFTVLALK